MSKNVIPCVAPTLVILPLILARSRRYVGVGWTYLLGEIWVDTKTRFEVCDIRHCCRVVRGRVINKTVDKRLSEVLWDC